MASPLNSFIAFSSHDDAFHNNCNPSKWLISIKWCVNFHSFKLVQMMEMSDARSTNHLQRISKINLLVSITIHYPCNHCVALLPIQSDWSKIVWNGQILITTFIAQNISRHPELYIHGWLLLLSVAKLNKMNLFGRRMVNGNCPFPLPGRKHS